MEIISSVRSCRQIKPWVLSLYAHRLPKPSEKIEGRLGEQLRDGTFRIPLASKMDLEYHAKVGIIPDGLVGGH